MRFLPRALSLTALAAVCLIGPAGCRREARAGLQDAAPPNDGSVSVPEGAPLRQELIVATVERREVRSKLLAPAIVEADPAHLAKVAPPLTGQVRQLLVRQGELVRKGQPLFILDAPDVVAARADFLHARSVLGQAERALRRQQDLLEHAIAAQRDVEEAQTSFDVSRDDLRRAELRLELLGIEPGRFEGPLTVRSPLAGQVLALATAPGEFRNDATVPLLVVADLTSLWVTASVPEHDVERVRLGEEAFIRVAACDEREFRGKVLFVENVLDTDTRCEKVRIQLPNPDLRLKPGMFATVLLLGAAVPAIVVPTTALLVSDTSFVWVEKAPWRFIRRPVQLASQDRESAVVSEGLQAGERIVVRNGALLP